MWSNDRWRLRHLPETGLPVMLTLDPVAHHDLNDLTPELAAELGTLMVAVAVAVEQLPICTCGSWDDLLGRVGGTIGPFVRH